MSNAKQREIWNGGEAKVWVERLDHFERGFIGINKVLLAFACLEPGMAVIDIGCGAGTTTEAIARAVKPGRTVGLDISNVMVEAARARSGGATMFIEADATDYPFVPEFDLVFSRLGFSFFEDPAASFANIRKCLKPGGRMVFLTWRPMLEPGGLWDRLQNVLDFVPAFASPPPNTPGPFGLADSNFTRAVLEEAGWKNIVIEAANPPSLVGATLAEAADQVMVMGPVAHALKNADAATKAKVRERITPLLAQWQSAEGIAPPAACWLVEARP